MSATTTKDVLDEFARVLGTDKKQGRVTLIGSATEVPDEGDDIVEKGAFKETLLKRKPKIILGHDWKQKVARVVSIREYMPGDPELKALLDSAEHKVMGWPEEAGALVAEVQFNFDTQRGRDAFADVLFYEDEGEWSIGYRVRDSYKKKGIRHIKRLDLYEISFVLHGMNRWSKTLSVKDVFGGSAPASTDRGFGMTAGLPKIGVRKRDEGWSLVRTETDTDLRFFDTEEEAYEALRRMSTKGTAFLPSERMTMAERKIALPDGSMPIINTKDLMTGIKVADALQDEKVRQHVLDRATVMGRKSLVDFRLEVKKDYSKAKREEFADKGWALPDGSFPIADREDLKNAISLAHLGSDPEKAWAHILKRAKALGAMDVVPDEKKAARLSNTENAVTDDRTVLVDDVGTPEGQAPKPDDCGCENCPDDCTCVDCPVMKAATMGETKAGGADRNRGGAEHLRRYWLRGEGAAKIRWGTSGDFTRCVRLLRKHMPSKAKGFTAEGYCANRHKEANGFWPGDKRNKSAFGDDSVEEFDWDEVRAAGEFMTENGLDDWDPPMIEVTEVGLGAKGMGSDMTAAMAVNAFRDLRDGEYEESEVEIVRDGIKALADALGDDNELHLAVGLFPEENAAFAASSVKSVKPDADDDTLDTVREAIFLLSSALEVGLFGPEYKHAGPWTEEYQPGKHTGPDKPGFNSPDKPSVIDAPEIQPVDMPDLDSMDVDTPDAPEVDPPEPEAVDAPGSDTPEIEGVDAPAEGDLLPDDFDDYRDSLGMSKGTAYVSRLEGDDVKAVRAYTEEKYRPINRALRKGDPLSPPEENEEIAQRLDAVIDAAPRTETEGKVYRGISARGGFVDSLVEGAVIEDEGFASTTTDEATAVTNFAAGLRGDDEFDEYGVQLNITVPAGSKALPVAEASDFAEEREVLLPRGSKYRVVSKRQTDAGGYIVDVELVTD